MITKLNNINLQDAPDSNRDIKRTGPSIYIKGCLTEAKSLVGSI
jgi:hypothetical protein